MGKGKMMSIAGVAVLLLLLALPASADVVVKQKTTSSMMGGMMKTTDRSTLYVSGEKQCAESELKSEMPMFDVPGVKTASIVRLDKELTWNLDHEGKTYTEMSFAQMKMYADSLSGMQQGYPEEESPVGEDVEYSEPELKVERTGNKEKIKGFACEEVILRVIVRGKDKKTGDTGSFHLHDRMWVAKDCPGGKEYMDFSRKIALKMGGFEGSDSPASPLAVMGLGSEFFADEMAKIEGFPMRQEMTMTISGNLAQQSDEERAEQEEAMGQASEMLKGLGGLLGKKDEKPEEKTESGSASGVFFESTVEVESISTDPVDAGKFEIPKGYKKTE